MSFDLDRAVPATSNGDMKGPTSTGPLTGIRVIDMTYALAGPFCTLLLAGLGAEVIKVEAPSGGDLARANPPFLGPNGISLTAAGPDDLSISVLNRNRNKRSVTLDLKSRDGRQLLHRLIGTGDVFVQNLGDGVADRLGADYASLQQVNPRLVYCSIAGLGDGSPFKGLKVMDILVQALSGIMDVTGEQDGRPTRVGIPIGDLCGPLFAVSAILAALRVAERDGIGQQISVNLVDALASLVAVEHFDALGSTGFQIRSGNSHSRLAPFGVYRCLDGYIAIAAPTDEWFLRLAAAIGRSDIINDARFSSRSARAKYSADLDGVIEAWTSEQTTADALQVLFGQASVPAAPVRSVNEVLSDESLHLSGAVSDLCHPDLPIHAPITGSGLPWNFSVSSVGLHRPAPRLGADNDAVYRDLLGLSPDDLAELRRRRVI